MTMTTILLFLMLQATTTAQTPPVQPPAQAAAAAQNPNTDYRVGPQDKLNIAVLGIPEFSVSKVIVENDGKFDYLNLGRIQAQDKTVQEIAKEVRDLLIATNQHTGPSVSVDVEEYRSQMVYVSGAVKNSMGFKITGNETLMNVLAQAGFTPSSGAYVEVTRNKPAPSKTYRFDRKALETGTAPPFRLQDQDTIVVPDAEKCFIRGEVKAPGTYEVTSNMTVLQLIISAGDFTERASKGGVQIMRSDANGKPTKIKVAKDLSTIVLPGDTITVGKRWM
jgi:polysaccharide export outer membrane protein